MWRSLSLLLLLVFVQYKIAKLKFFAPEAIGDAEGIKSIIHNLLERFWAALSFWPSKDGK